MTITPGEELNGRFGCYRHSDLVGKPYGSKIGSRNGKGFIHVLRPTPELWTLALPHRTQILYVADIAFVTSWLGIKPGSVVIEAGKVTYLTMSDGRLTDLDRMTSFRNRLGFVLALGCPYHRANWSFALLRVP